MKTFLNACGALGLSALLLLAARNLGATAEPELTSKSVGTVARSSTVVAFNSYARAKVVQYFDTYRTEPLGLPPGFGAKVEAEEIPLAWGISRIAPGSVVQESERACLVEAPPELVRILRTDSRDFHYYVAGRSLVAMNKDYRVVDSVLIPTIRLTAEESSPLQLVSRIGSPYR